MLRNFFLRLWSFVLPIKQETISSSISGTLEIFLYKNRYQLVTKNAIYSFEDLYTSYGKALNSISYENVDTVLVLGLGLGSIPQMIQKKMQGKANITCVEIDKDIIRCAEKYYPDKLEFKKLNIITSDAYDYVYNTKDTFSLITVDLFIDTAVPEKFYAIAFLQKLKLCLAPSGIILFSRLINGKSSESVLWHNLEKTFPGKFEIETEGNSIMYWRNTFAL